MHHPTSLTDKGRSETTKGWVIHATTLSPSSPCHFQFQCSFLFPGWFRELVSFHSALSPCPLPVVHYSHHSTDSALSWGTSDLITRFHGQFSVLIFLAFWNTGLLLIFSFILKCSICYSDTRHFYFFYHLSNKEFKKKFFTRFSSLACQYLHSSVSALGSSFFLLYNFFNCHIIHLHGFNY